MPFLTKLDKEYFLLIRIYLKNVCLFKKSHSECFVSGRHNVYRMAANTEEEKDGWIDCIRWAFAQKKKP